MYPLPYYPKNTLSIIFVIGILYEGVSGTYKISYECYIFEIFFDAICYVASDDTLSEFLSCWELLFLHKV